MQKTLFFNGFLKKTANYCEIIFNTKITLTNTKNDFKQAMKIN